MYNTHRNNVNIPLSLFCPVLSCVSSMAIRDGVFDAFLRVYPRISNLLESNSNRDSAVGIAMCEISVGLRVSTAQYKSGDKTEALSTMRRTLSRLDKMNHIKDEHLKLRVCRFKVEALQGIGAMAQDVMALRRGLNILQVDLKDFISAAAVSHSISALLAKKRDWESSCKQYGITLEILKRLSEKSNGEEKNEAMARIYVELAVSQSMMGAENLANESLKNAVEYDGEGDKIKMHMQFQDLLSRYKA